jgi:hypothetical protein
MYGKKLVSGLFVLMALHGMCVGELWAQTQTPSTKARDEMKMPMYYSSGGGGPMLMAALLDLRELENTLASLKLGGDLIVADNKVFLLVGGGGFGGPGQMHYGGIGWGGEWTVKYNDPNNQFTQASLSLEGGGFLLERLLTSTQRWNLGLGCLVGGSDLTLRFDSKVSDGPWTEVVKTAKSLELTRSYFAIEPFVSMHVKILNFLGLRVSAGYLYQISFGEWELQDETKAKGGPLKMLSAPVFSLMLVFGK